VAAGGAYDAIVLGLGAMGSAAAAHLARRGLGVLGIEQYGEAHDRGSSHGESRMIRQAYFEDPGYVPLVLRAYELWRELEAETGTELLTLTGGLLLGAPGSATVRGGMASAERFGLPYRLLERAELVAEFPTFDPPPGTVALFEPDAGFVRPEAAIRAQLALARRHGAELHLGEQVTGWSIRSGAVEVATASGRYRARRLVLCPGPWAPQVLEELKVPLVVERQVLHWFEPAGPLDPYLLGAHPVWIYEPPAGGLVLYGFPALSKASGVKVAFFGGGAPCRPEGIERRVGEEEVDAIAAALAGVLPGLPGRFLRATTCMFTNSPDRHFVVGELPGAPEVLLACGFSGHGFKFAPAIGEALAELATGGDPATLPGALFSPSRV